MQRRTVLRQGLCVFGAGLPLASNAQSVLSRFKGSTLRIHYPAHPHFERVERQFARFTQLTGIRIESQRAPYLEMKPRQLESLAKPAGDFDLLAYLILWKMEYAQAGHLRALQPYFADERLALPGFDFSDLIGPYVQAIGRVGPAGVARTASPGTGPGLFGLPCGTETSLLAARTDLLARHGLQMPTQYSELLNACRVLRDREGIGGLATRGQAGHHITHAWLLHLSPHGGAVLDGAGRATLHHAGGLRATQVLRDIAALAAPGVEKAGFTEMQDDFLQGRAAFYLDSSNILCVATDARRTRLADRFGYAMHPTGTRLSGQTGGFGLGIPANAALPEAAFLFLQWLLSPATDLAMARDGGVPARWSTLSNPDFRAAHPQQSIMRFALRAANPNWRPLIPQWDRISRDVIGKALPAMVLGERPVAEGLTELAAAIDAELLEPGRRALR
jgi:multiple sugar transport system substrate-binding protein